MFDLGPEKILIVLAAVLIFLGPKELPAAMRTINEWRQKLHSLRAALHSELNTMVALPADKTSTTDRGSDDGPNHADDRSEPRESGFPEAPTSFS